MQGTQPDGRVTVHQGALQADAELLYFFDYYLSAQGEMALPKIVEALRRELGQRLQQFPKALAQAEELLGRYLAYKKALWILEQDEALASSAHQPPSARLRVRLQRLQHVRGQYFSPSEAESFFRLDEARDADAISRMEIFEDNSLSFEEKQQKFAQLDASLPTRLKEDREASQRISLVEQQVAQMRSAGASDQEVHRFRSMQFTKDAADRLQALDHEEQKWIARIQQYQSDLTQLLRGTASTDGPPSSNLANLHVTQQATVQALRDRHFSAQEQRRLAAYEIRH
jgi:lipase chaperone LimK